MIMVDQNLLVLSGQINGFCVHSVFHKASLGFWINDLISLLHDPTFEYKNKEYEKYKLKRWTLQCYCLFTVFSMENECTI